MKGIWAMLVVLALCVACQKPPVESERGYPLADVSIVRDGSVVLQLVAEVARDEQAMARGLQDVPSLSDKQAMVFDFERPTETGFWMKDVAFDLDIAFWGQSGEVLQVRTMQTCSKECPVYGTPGKIRGAIETRAGVLKGHVKQGDEVVVRPR